jgi:hypothetical protein
MVKETNPQFIKHLLLIIQTKCQQRLDLHFYNNRLFLEVGPKYIKDISSFEDE